VIGQGSSEQIANYPTEILMSVARTICLTIALACSGYLHAQSCSGGVDGGMDATGNQCNTPAELATYATGTGAFASKPMHPIERSDRAVAKRRQAKNAEARPSTDTVLKPAHSVVFQAGGT
jgi:hypothetical protein